MRQLQKRHPDARQACAWHSLSPLVDCIAPSVAQIDAAYFVLEDMHAKVSNKGNGSFDLQIYHGAVLHSDASPVFLTSAA